MGDENISKILVIKQTSLGDVLHSTGHIRVIKQHFPTAYLCVLTATESADIYRDNPYVDELILFPYQQVKSNLYRRPNIALHNIIATIKQLRRHNFDIAFDLQGLFRSVLFLYASRAQRKYVKGNWLGLAGLRDPKLPVLTEMAQVLNLAGIKCDSPTMQCPTMELFSNDKTRREIDILIDNLDKNTSNKNINLQKTSIQNRRLIIFSPFSKWQSKDWPLINYLELAKLIHTKFSYSFTTVITAENKYQANITKQLKIAADNNTINLAGQLSIAQLAELISRATILISGDSFPMHIAWAKNIPHIAFFAPTDDKRIGPPPSEITTIIRPPTCKVCDKPTCRRNCLTQISVQQIFTILTRQLQNTDYKIPN